MCSHMYTCNKQLNQCFLLKTGGNAVLQGRLSGWGLASFICSCVSYITRKWLRLVVVHQKPQFSPAQFVLDFVLFCFVLFWRGWGFSSSSFSVSINLNIMFLSTSFTCSGHEMRNETYLYCACRAMVKIITVPE